VHLWAMHSIAMFCRDELVQQVRERLYGDVQNYNSLLVENAFEAKALQIWETDPTGSEDSWREIKRIALPQGPEVS
jgi:hypothetical protein